ncbi:MAG: AsnC family transcriptional regulator [Gaiellales bacterium]
MDDVDRRLLDRLQNELPLVARPWAALAEELGMPEDELLERIGGLRGEGVVRQISAIFDTRRLGYRSSLVAARSKPGQQQFSADVFSAHPGVTHNYEREHAFDLWFTIAVPPDTQIGLDGTIELLGRMADVESIRPLPALRFFKIGVDLDMVGGRDPAAKKARRAPTLEAPSRPATEREVAAVRALQQDLPAIPEPLVPLAEEQGFTVDELLAVGREMLEDGRMRRFAAVLNHRKAGFLQNGMGVWIVDEDRVEEAGRIMAGYRGVSHCYERPVYPDWPYRLFSMTHGRDKEECEAVLAALSEETGLDEYAVLYSIKEFKKTRLRYFDEDATAWEAAHLALA